jgi:hypothetical protein
VNLTAAEIIAGRKCLQDIEKRSKQWRWARWLNLIVLVAMPFIVVVIILSLQLTIIEQIMELAMVDNADNVTAVDLRIYANQSAMLWSTMVAMWVLLTYWAILGVSTLVSTISNWNRHVHDMLLASVLRRELEAAATKHEST